MLIKLNNKYELNLLDHREQQWKGLWESQRIDALMNNIKKGDLIVDVGAEQGDISALMARKSKRIVLLEPGNMWGNIKETWRINQLVDPLICYHGFASNLTTKEQPKDYAWPVAEQSEKNNFKNLAEDGTTLPQVRLDDLLAGQRVDILNIDVEGSEFEVLKGAKRILTFDMPLVFVSVHPEFMFWHHHQYESELHGFMASHGYKAIHLAFDHEHHYVFVHPEGRQYA